MERRSPSSTDKVERAVAWAMLAVIAALALCACVIAAQSSSIAKPEQLPIPDDIPLVSDYHKQLAQLDGYAVYQRDGVWYVDPNIPPEYLEVKHGTTE